MKRYEALQEMIQGHLDGMRDILDGNVSSNANRSNSYRYAYEEAVASWKQRPVKRPRNKTAEEAAIVADIGCLTRSGALDLRAMVDAAPTVAK